MRLRFYYRFSDMLWRLIRAAPFSIFSAALNDGALRYLFFQPPSYTPPAAGKRRAHASLITSSRRRPMPPGVAFVSAIPIIVSRL